jgi:hypothetical protein
MTNPLSKNSKNSGRAKRLPSVGAAKPQEEYFYGSATCALAGFGSRIQMQLATRKIMLTTSSGMLLMSIGSELYLSVMYSANGLNNAKRTASVSVTGVRRIFLRLAP